ncbi:L,D-transpeptidase [Micromonospora sp. WMMD736]|uniref:L,D-transpeptidase n=1 Tax=Micromonospora sp. WMMD736 TaxID=3404112 RepID=UPI003B9409EF
MRPSARLRVRSMWRTTLTMRRPQHLEGMVTVGKALRLMFAVLGITAITAAGTASPSQAAVPTGETVASIEPANGAVVGVAHPVVVTFGAPVTDRAVVEQSLTISAPQVPAGEFTWLSDRVMQWDPTGFWPAHSAISVSVGGASTSFESAASVVAVADISAHTFTVSIGGEVARQMPASMGKAKFPTPVGRFSALQKQRNVTFDSRTIGIPLSDPEGYLIQGEYGVRVTWGGVYVHSAPWSVGSQGYANVSHGCINLSPDNAAWYFNQVRVGDPIIVQY